jgi:NUDIX domain
MTVTSRIRKHNNNAGTSAGNSSKSRDHNTYCTRSTSVTILQISIICNVVLLSFLGFLLFQQQQSLSLALTRIDRNGGNDERIGNPMTMMRQLNNRTSISGIRYATRDYQFHGGHPQTSALFGSCFCSSIDTYCMCNPSLAIDIVIMSGADHLWFVRRKDTDQLAIVGGFVDIGEAVIDAVYRELFEETGLLVNDNTGRITTASSTATTQQPYHVTQPVLFGIYSDPRRDNRTSESSYILHGNM